MSNRRPKNVIALLLLVSAIFVSASYFNVPQPVQAAPSVTLDPTFAGRGALISVSGSGFSFPNGTTLGKGMGNPVSCGFFSLDRLNNPGTLISSPICTITSSSNDSFSGSFIVNGVLSPINNPYTFIVNMTDRSSPSVAHAIKSQVTFTVTAIKLTPPLGPRAAVINVTGALSASATTCSISGSVVGTQSCIISGSTGGNFTGSFVVANVAPGPYTVTVSGTPGSVSVQATFIVTGPKITASPGSGVVGTFVIVNGTGFAFTDTTCTISSPTSGTFIQNPACSINAGTGKPSGSFTVGNVAVGSYVIRVQGQTGDFADFTFKLVAGPAITLSPGSGAVGIQVIFNGTGFQPSDTTCSISGTPVQNGACSIALGSGAPSGTFTVRNVAPGTYTITVSANGGDSAQKTFVVTTGAKITLSPGTGVIGIQVIVNGTGYLPTDSTCSISGTGSVVTADACHVNLGSGTPSGTFIVGNVAPGSYVITLSANGGDSAQATFIVTTGAKITLSPGSGAIGIRVIVNGTGYLPSDNSCSISGTGGVVTGSACKVNLGSGTPSGTFIVGNVAPGSYVITLSATPGSDSAQATFIVTTGPSITLSPTFGPPGASIGVTGSAFSASDIACTISGSGSSVFSSSCNIVAGSKTPTGTFVVGFAVPGFYLITVTGNTGDHGSAVFEVINVTATLTLSATRGPSGLIVTFRGTGFNSTDTGCVVETHNPAPFAAFNNLLITSPSCSMGSTIATGSFVVGPLATQNVPWNVTVRGTPRNDIPAFASFNVTAVVTITPTTGNIGTVFSFTGTGFHSDATGCTTFSFFSPALSGGASLAANGPGGCAPNSSTGQLTGSFVPPPGTIAGVYVLTVIDNEGGSEGSSASMAFTIGTPSALVTILPNTITPPTTGSPFSVGVTGANFNAGDTGCTVTVSAPVVLSGSCVMSGGTASATLLVPVGTPSALYLVTVKGTPTMDFASNYLAVNAITTLTSTTTSSTTSTTATTTTTLTTFTSISSSFTTTTITSTGPTTIIFPQGTLTTVSAVTATTTTVLGYTASPTTATTTTFVTSTFGQIIGPSLSDELGILGVAILLVPALLRRLLK